MPQKFQDLKEASDFWDTHSAADFWDESLPADVAFDLDDTPRYVALDCGLARRLRKIAQTRGVSPETLINLWVREKLG
jgi:CopG antitoxin of type II toxin-antitoxin system